MGVMSCGVGEDRGAAVSSTPLTGTIDGRAFTATTALATGLWLYGTNNKWIAIYEVPQGCEDFTDVTAPEGVRRILIASEWRPMTEEFSEGDGVNFQLGKEDEWFGTSVSEGRLELIDTPTGAGQVGTLRLRAIHGPDRVEGQVSVTVCD
jgi:hypothetical protein